VFEVGQAVLVISDKGVAYDGYIVARAIGDNGGSPAYQVAPQGSGQQQKQWHRSCDVFVVEAAPPEEVESIDSFLRKR
jgi:hypothetical protein